MVGAGKRTPASKAILASLCVALVAFSARPTGASPGVAPVECASTRLGQRPIPPPTLEQILAQRVCRLRTTGDPVWQEFRLAGTTPDTLVVQIGNGSSLRYDWSDIDRIDRRGRLGPVRGTLIGFGSGAAIGVAMGALHGIGEPGCTGTEFCIPVEFAGLVIGATIGTAAGLFGLSWVPRWDRVYCAE